MHSFTRNQFYFWQMLWGNVCHADWDEAYANGGLLGWIAEFMRAVTGFSAWPFFVPRAAGWTPEALQDLLDERGIVTWGWGTEGDDWLFHVKLRQAHWAQYLLLEAGVPLSERLLDGNGYGARRRRKPATGHQAPRGGYRPTRSPDNPAPAVQPDAVRAHVPASPTPDPIGRINHLVDRLADW